MMGGMNIEEEMNAKVDVINWVLGHIEELDMMDKMQVGCLVLDLANKLEPVYAKYNGKVFYVDLGDLGKGKKGKK